MTGHGGVQHYGADAPMSGFASTQKEGAWVAMRCGHCGIRTTAAVLARDRGSPPTEWVRCIRCGRGAVIDGPTGAQSPAPLPGEGVQGLPAEVEAAYAEARRCLGAGAHNAAEMMSRRILIHVAMDKGAEGVEGFDAYVDYLEDAGYVTTTMRHWVDRIRQHANAASQALPEQSPARAADTVAFTTQLLRLVYEVDFLAGKYGQHLDHPTAAAS